MKKNFLLLFLIPYLNIMSQSVHYRISITNPNSHYAQVEFTIPTKNKETLNIKMPVWTPGSYMVREFEKNIDNVEAFSGDTKLEIAKTDKSTWQIKCKKDAEQVTVRYPIYCFEKSVRTSYIDSEHAFLLLTSVLMYSEETKQQAGTLTLNYPNNWKKVATTLDSKGLNEFAFNNYDELVDSPIEIGNHEEINFLVQNIPHKAVLVGENNCNKDILKKDMEKICETMFKVVGKHPCKSYLFVIHHVENGGGGLEHANSCVVQMPRLNYNKPDKYLGFLSLIAHEYFHLWNVKRIRPIALNPFDYSKENYTNLLWVAEGITSYYDELAMYRAGFYSLEKYLSVVAGNLNTTYNRIGASVQGMHHASFDAWIKEYRTTENSANTNISYYTKGATLALLLNASIVSSTNGSKNLDDLMQYLYKNYYEDKGRGFTDLEFYSAIDAVAGKSLGFEKWALEVNDASTFEKWQEVLSKVGINISKTESNQKTYTGINTEIKGENTYIKTVNSNSPAITAGLQPGDELITCNSYRIKQNFNDLIDMHIGKSIEITFNRDGIINKTQLVLDKSYTSNIQVAADKSNTLINSILSKP